MKQLTTDFKTKLDKVMKKIDKTYVTLNYGGCGAFAKELGDIIKKKGFEVKYLLVISRKDEIKESIRNNNSGKISGFRGTSWCHIMLIVNGKLVDSEGVFNRLNERFGGKKYGIKLSENVLETWLGEDYYRDWNPTFNREKFIPQIKKNLEKYLAD